MANDLTREKKVIANILKKKDWFRMDLSIHKDYVPKLKNVEQSIKFRNEGNSMYRKNNHNFKIHEKILDCYTKSIALAPNDSEELAIAYGNRSALLYHVSIVDECIKDIDRAIKITKSDKLKAKLLCRKVECLAAMQNENFTKVCETVTNYIQEIELDEIVRKTYFARLKNAMNGHIKEIRIKSKKEPPTYFPKSVISCFSDALSVKIDAIGGHMIANRNIKVGETISVEEAYSGNVALKMLYMYCSYCFQFTASAIPCENCFYAVYCSDKCRDKAWLKYHDIECPLIRVLGTMKDEPEKQHDLLHIKIIIQALKEAGSVKALRKHLREIDESKGFRMEEVLSLTAYQRLYILLRNIQIHEKVFMMDSTDCCLAEMIGVWNILTLNLLNAYTPIFGEEFKNPQPITENSDIVFICALLLRHKLALPLLTTNVGRMAIEMGTINEQSAEEIVTSDLFIFTKLFQHSCNPNAMNLISGNKMIVYSCYPIKKGEEVTTNFHRLHYSIQKKEERQDILLKFNTKVCECVACRENWPLKDEIPLWPVQLNKFPKKKDEFFRQLSAIKYRLRNYNPDDLNELISDTVEHIEVFYKYIGAPCAELAQFCYDLQHTYGSFYKDVHQLPDACSV